MFYSSFDILFVILCVTARATSHTLSNTSKTPNQLQENHHASFIDLVLDTSLKQHHRVLGPNDSTMCALMSNFLNNAQMNFCRKHQDILETILPQVMNLTKKECTRITQDLRWNCSSIDLFLDRSNPLALTKEASVIRSILNASLMYLVVRFCTYEGHRSCGCLGNTFQSTELRRLPMGTKSLNTSEVALKLTEQDLSFNDLLKLDSGGPLHLGKTLAQRQGCIANLAFANAFVKVLLDSEDQKSLNRASKILSDSQNGAATPNRAARRVADTELKELAYLRWTKSAIHLHNNNVGRQIIKETIQKQCRCHGISGACQFQTCWDRLPDLDVITTRLRHVYLSSITKAYVMNLGTYEKPDLYLTRENSTTSFSDIDRVNPRELLYLYNSPDYCEPLPAIGHSGTTGRACALDGPHEAPGSCRLLCCNRGYSSELVLSMVTCDCRFTLCCRIDCEYCIRQRVQHYCL